MNRARRGTGELLVADGTRELLEVRSPGSTTAEVGRARVLHHRNECRVLARKFGGGGVKLMAITHDTTVLARRENHAGRSVASRVMRRLFVLLVVVALSSLAGCNTSADRRPTLKKGLARNSPTTTSTLPSYISLVAEARVLLVEVFDEPDDTTTPTHKLGNPWFVIDDKNLPVKQVFLVKQAVDNWYEVYLPVRPNGTTGWIRGRDATIVQSPYRIVVELFAHRITVYNGESILLQEAVAIGKPSTPTPTGTYYTRVLLKAPDPNTVYGPYAYPLSGHSNVLTSFNGGDGELGIHGNNDTAALGHSVTAGCIRMSNSGITRLAPLIPLGSPVEIRA